MCSKARKFFVGGNFKSNGTIASIKSILEGLNNAKLSNNVGSNSTNLGLNSFMEEGILHLSFKRENKLLLKQKLILLTEVVVAPPALYLLLAKEIAGNGVEVAAQNAYDKGNGAYTGEISAQQLKDARIHWVILGHSERRSIFGESDQVSSCCQLTFCKRSADKL